MLQRPAAVLLLAMNDIDKAGSITKTQAYPQNRSWLISSNNIQAIEGNNFPFPKKNSLPKEANVLLGCPNFRPVCPFNGSPAVSLINLYRCYLLFFPLLKSFKCRYTSILHCIIVVVRRLHRSSLYLVLVVVGVRTPFISRLL
jgi:hypothetical protein